MTNRTHPSEVLLADYASGALPTAAGLTVSAHLSSCAACAGKVDQLVEAGGVLLSGLPDAPLARGALAATLARLDSPAAQPAPPQKGLTGVDLPAVVLAVGFGPRRWFGRGAWVAHTKASTAHGWRSFILSLPAGGRLPAHGHRGLELTAVLQGAFADDTGWHGPGDFVTADHAVEHDIVVSAQGRCVCLVSTQGPFLWRNPWLGALRPLTGL
ncbi:ChrR family anti-sigma-E factor [Phenylobacterium sp.]|uniref:ChrR family anti-sigma-E factor n=1 Tax=Phenylobacterium sp. TaxID=1871053 RepID=UPI00286CBBEF|nr:ChrR family anti-sigma-E factor [Phenylobacterium sp.]